MALLDNGTQINAITPSYVKSHSLEVGLITDLIGRCVTCIDLGNAYTQPLGYIIIQVQVEGVQGYIKDQIGLIVPDLLNFAVWVPIILGTPTIRTCHKHHEREGDRHLGDTLGKCLGGPPLVSVKGCSHSGR